MFKHLSIENWHKYQARTDKELPWLKLWGSMFDKPWWQELADNHKIIPIIFLDAARRFNNKLPKNADYYLRNYNLLLTPKEFLKVCKSLQSNGFLSDCLVRLSSDSSTLILSKEKDKESEEKGKHGEEGLVHLTAEEEKKLTEKMGEKTTAGYIQKLENYVGSKGRKYKSHYHTILTWWQKDGKPRDPIKQVSVIPKKEELGKQLSNEERKDLIESALPGFTKRMAKP